MAFHPSTKNKKPMSEINMIPMIDVMLVLLIVFIISAPLLTNSVKIDLPTASSNPVDTREKSVQLAIKSEGNFYWNGTLKDKDSLQGLMLEASHQTPQPEIQLQADAHTSYETVAQVMVLLSRSGLAKIAFISLPEKP
ncbi:biopolymer transporter ExbD [Buttiauxella noackiae]|uniref:ExbD/TolR family protein n=1 Tax=Buttiauxella noackiae TaxID=82992 RepID=UPI0028D6322E|nr:biopolymer transporter ExbD [Buttiauxella noackiae]